DLLDRPGGARSAHAAAGDGALHVRAVLRLEVPRRARSGAARMKKADPNDTRPVSERIEARIEELGGWRGETPRRPRGLIKAGDPDIVEEWKWNVPVWSHGGIVCTGEAYKSAVKLTFARGAAVEDPSRLFNSSLDGGTRRAIDFREGGTIDEAAFKALI